MGGLEHQHVQKTIDAIEAGRRPLVGGVDFIMSRFCFGKMSWEAQLAPRVVGVDPTNRDGVGVTAENVIALGRDILFVGWSWAEVAKAVCIEAAPGSCVIEDFNKALTANNAALAPVEEDTIRFGSVSCSHTNAFLRCLRAGRVSTMGTELGAGTDASETLTLTAVRDRDPEFAKAAEDGIRWTVLSHKVRELFPAFLGLLQSARNATGQVAKPEHEVQVMCRILTVAAATQRASAVSDSLTASATSCGPDWSVVKRAVLRSRPPCAFDFDDLKAFVVACAGGMEGMLLQDLMVFHRRCVKSDDRIIRGPFFRAVADLPLLVPRLKIAIVKTQYTCPVASLALVRSILFVID